LQSASARAATRIIQITGYRFIACGFSVPGTRSTSGM